MKIIQQYNHVQYNPMLTTLLIHELVFQSGKQRLNSPHTHTPLSGLSHQCCLNVSLNLLSLLFSTLCRQVKDILRRLYKERMIHFCKCWVNCTLSTRCLVNFIQLVIDFTLVCNLTSPGTLKNAIGIVLFGQKQRQRSCSDRESIIVELFLHIRFPTLLEIKFESINCGPKIGQSRVSLGNGLHVLVNCLFRWNANSSKRVVTKHIDNNAADKS